MLGLSLKGEKGDKTSDALAEKADYGYKVWFVAAIIASVVAIRSTSHYDIIAKIAWTIIAPGFTFSQTWNKAYGVVPKVTFGVLLIIHVWIVQLVFPHIPQGHYGYILIAALSEIMTLGLAYQVGLHLRSASRHSEQG